MDSGTFTYESLPLEYEEFPFTTNIVHILGRTYSALHDRDELKHDIRSRLWITYRRNFHNIGGLKGPNTDTGWGCMLRCGQMMLAQALVLHHLGRAWRWNPGCADEKYWKILRMFEDRKMATYSIHQIASMGEAEGKSVGQWFGPNTIAQVLKRIAVYDEWSRLVIHVALDNIVIVEEILKLCKPQDQRNEAGDENQSGHANGESADKFLPKGEKFSHFVNDDPSPHGARCDGLRNRPVANDSNGDGGSATNENLNQIKSPQTDAGWDPLTECLKIDISSSSSSSVPSFSPPSPSSTGKWKPLVLIIPLRLGLTDINPIYFESLKKCFTLKQSIGIIGGKPNHAHYFIGYVGKELIYLDPHTTQNLVDLDSRSMDSDLSYHCDTPPSRMSFSRLDPSIALGFYCATEQDLRELLYSFSQTSEDVRPMFEVREHAPQAWPSQGCEGLKVSVSTTELSGRTRGISLSDFVALDGLIGAGGSSVDDEEFEML